ncbi:MAG: GCG_CRPN prefix-to-repeats domain-containing protein [Methylocystis sp.]|jgi:hypothetical protein
MKSVTVKTVAALAIAGGFGLALSPAQALPGLDRGVAAGAAPMVEKVWCGPYGCRPGWGGYGYGSRPRPWGYGYGWRPRPMWGRRPWGGWGGAWQ